MLQEQLNELHLVADNLEVDLKHLRTKLYHFEADIKIKGDASQVSEDLAVLISDLEESVPTIGVNDV